MPFKVDILIMQIPIGNLKTKNIQMKQLLFFTSIVLLMACSQKIKPTEKVYFEENWESLQSYKIPQWMKDAKFGIFIHWGPNSVAELHTDWYPRWMYLDKGIMNPQTGEITNGKPHLV